MTGNVLIDLVISFVGIAILVGLARFIFADAVAAMSKPAAAERLAFDEPDFQPAEWLVDQKNGSALAVNDSGEVALVKVVGDGFVTRRWRAGALSCSRDGMVLIVSPPDQTFQATTVSAGSGDEAQRWALRFAS